MEPVLDFTGHDVNLDDFADDGTVIALRPGKDYFFVQFDDGDPRWVICYLDRARKPVRTAPDSDEIVFTDANEQATALPHGTRVVCTFYPHGNGRFKASAWAPADAIAPKIV